MKQNFVPNLVIEADYDVDLYRHLLETSDFWKRIIEAPAEKLPELSHNTIETVQKLYDELTRRQQDELDRKWGLR